MIVNLQWHFQSGHSKNKKTKPANPEKALGARMRSNNKLNPHMTWVRFDLNLALLSVCYVSCEFFYDGVINSELKITHSILKAI